MLLIAVNGKGASEQMIIQWLCVFLGKRSSHFVRALLTLEALRGGGGGQIDPPPPSIFLALNFCFLTDCQKLWHNCSLFGNTSFDTN